MPRMWMVNPGRPNRSCAPGGKCPEDQLHRFLSEHHEQTGTGRHHGRDRQHRFRTEIGEENPIHGVHAFHFEGLLSPKSVRTSVCDTLSSRWEECNLTEPFPSCFTG